MDQVVGGVQHQQGDAEEEPAGGVGRVELLRAQLQAQGRGQVHAADPQH